MTLAAVPMWNSDQVDHAPNHIGDNAMEHGGHHHACNRVRDQHHSDGRQCPCFRREVPFESIDVSGPEAAELSAIRQPQSVRLVIRHLLTPTSASAE